MPAVLLNKNDIPAPRSRRKAQSKKYTKSTTERQSATKRQPASPVRAPDQSMTVYVAHPADQAAAAPKPKPRKIVQHVAPSVHKNRPVVTKDGNLPPGAKTHRPGKKEKKGFRDLFKELGIEQQQQQRARQQQRQQLARQLAQQREQQRQQQRQQQQQRTASVFHIDSLLS